MEGGHANQAYEGGASSESQLSSSPERDRNEPSEPETENFREASSSDTEHHDLGRDNFVINLNLSDNHIKIGDKTDHFKGKFTQQNERPDDFEIRWENIEYVVESKWWKISKQRRAILNGLSGSFNSGELSAVLGPSGAGKSTLIDCLMGKHEKGMSGKTRVQFRDPVVDVQRHKKRPLRIVVIPQKDHLLETLTVTETLMFASKIKNAHLTYEDEDTVGDESPKKTRIRKKFDHFANVQRVIKQLKLSSCAYTRCGKLSGGQYKRVSIGQELLSRPDVMILDEPTSGLDSTTCYQTVKALRDLIASSPYPMSIVSTIHQPDIEVFQLFDKAYVLAGGGRAIYEGPTDGIIETIRMGLEYVDNRHQMLSECTNIVSNKGNLDDLRKLNEKVESGVDQNPARLIVSVAAGEYGLEIINAMSELQTKSKEMMSSTGKFQTVPNNWRNVSGYNSSDSVSNSSNSSPDTKPRRTNLSPFLSVDQGSKLDRKKSASQLDLVEMLVQEQKSTLNDKIAPPKFDYDNYGSRNKTIDLDQILCLAVLAQKRSLWVNMKHCAYHMNRSWLTILRDPMLFSLQVFLHVTVPLLISYSFSASSTHLDACPRPGPLDIIDEAYREGNILEDLNKELRASIENTGYMFFQVYVIVFAAVCMTSLTYPLVMQVLLKEYRNGWYSLTSYFLGRTLADLPVPTINVIIAMAISYHLTGQPLSPYGWRFMSVTAVVILATLTAQTQGLIFGALLMNAAQSAVFVAPASTAPLVVVSGFLIRIQSLPFPLQIASKFSYFTYLINGFIISRYGFGRCSCGQEDFQIDESRQVPQQAKTLLNIWVETFANEYNSIEDKVNVTLSSLTKIPDIIEKLQTTITTAKTFNQETTNCNQMKPFVMIDYNLTDSDLKYSFIGLITMLVLFRFLTYLVLCWKIRSSL